jgi:zinc protease
MLSATALTASPYRRPIVGWMSDLEAMTAQDARDFYRKWYSPANTVVVVAGDVDPLRVKALADQYYGVIPARAVPDRKPRDEPAQQGLRRFEFKAPAEQSYVALAFKVPRLASLAPAPEHDEALALTVLAAVLDGYSGARLDRALTQGENRLADSAGAYNGLMGRGPQFFYLEGVPAKGQTPEALEAALRAQVQRVATEGVTVNFTEDAVDRLAEIAFQVNERQENIGARRLHTVLERLLDTLSYEAPDRDGETISIDQAYVDAHLGELVQDPDLSRYIL